MMEYEVLQDRVNAHDWRVEAFAEDGACFVTIFSGPDAEIRAKEYAAFKNQLPAAWMVTREGCDPAEFFTTADAARKNACLGVVDTHITPLFSGRGPR